MKLKKLLALSITLLATQNIFAASGQQQSECLKADLIKKVGVDSVEVSRDGDGSWEGHKMDRYGTNGTWMLVVGPIYAKSSKVALKKANASLSTLVFSGESHGPPWSVCEYTGNYEGKEIFALAIPGNIGS